MTFNGAKIKGTMKYQHPFLLSNSFLAFLLFLLFPVFSYANSSNFTKVVNYQGKLTDSAGATVADGNYNMQFKLYNTLTGGMAIWTGTLIQNDRPAVAGGLFSVMLGATSTDLSAIDFNQPLYLSINIGGTANTVSPTWDGEMSPRKTLGAVPAAFNSDLLDGLDSTSFVRSDSTSTIATTSTQTVLTLNQLGSGGLLSLQGSGMPFLTVTNSGFVGIGTTSPASLFSVVGGLFASTTATSTFQGGGINLITAAGNTGCFAANNVCVGGGGGSQTPWTSNIDGGGKNLTNVNQASTTLLSVSSQFFAGGTGTTTITSAGWVGVGTSTPGSILAVQGNALFAGNLTTTNITATGTLYIGSGNPSTDTIHAQVNQNNPTEVAVENDTNGTNASAVFHAQNINKGISLGYYAASYTFDPSFQDAGVLATDVNTSGGLILSDGSNSSNGIRFRTGTGGASPSQRAAITGNGLFGIGTTTPWAQLSASSTSAYPTLAIDQKGAGPAATFLGGSVGIGTTTPASTFTVTGSACISKGVGATAACDMTAGTITANVFNTAAADVAEKYQVSDGSIESGDIVSLQSDKPLFVQKAQQQGNLLGVVSTAPGVLLGSLNSPTEASTSRPIALSGRVPTKVNLEGGPISIGDKITVSSIAGVGKKAMTSDQTIGIALENYNGEPEKNGKILVFVSLGHQQVSPSGEISDAIFDKLLGQAKDWFSNIKEWSLDRFTADMVYVRKNFEVGTADNPAGITMYDQVTKQPYCLMISNGQIQSIPNSCGSQVAPTITTASIAPMVSATTTQLTGDNSTTTPPTATSTP